MLVVGPGGVLPPEAGRESHGDVPGQKTHLAGEMHTQANQHLQVGLGGRTWAEPEPEPAVGWTPPSAR